MEKCPNCDQKLSDAVWSANTLLNESIVKTINVVSLESKKGYCEKCGWDLFRIASKEIKSKIEELNLEYFNALKSIPLITSHSPQGWDYEIIGLVTGQSTTGTGVLTEIVSSINDLVGKQSKRHNEKIRKGEDICSFQIREQVIQKGGDAVIALDIDYAELGGGKGMIMVCMSGTIIKLKDLSVLSGEDRSNLNLLSETKNEIERLSELKLDE